MTTLDILQERKHAIYKKGENIEEIIRDLKSKKISPLDPYKDITAFSIKSKIAIETAKLEQIKDEFSFLMQAIEEIEGMK